LHFFFGSGLTEAQQWPIVFSFHHSVLIFPPLVSAPSSTTGPKNPIFYFHTTVLLPKQNENKKYKLIKIKVCSECEAGAVVHRQRKKTRAGNKHNHGTQSSTLL